MPLVARQFADLITFSRAGPATFFNSGGVLTDAAAGVPRLDFFPGTLLPRGLLIEESRTNSVRNNTMVGAVAGTPGTQPNTWTAWTNTISGVTPSIAGVGVEDGIEYVDIRWQGTYTGTTGTAATPAFSGSGDAAASISQNWAQSAFITLAAGSIGDASFNFRISELDSGQANLTGGDSAAIVPTAGALRASRRSFSRALTNAATAFVQPRFRIGFVNGSTYDFTLRIGLPQLEQGAFATSPIRTSGTAVTRALDAAVMSSLNPWFTQSAYTIVAEVESASPLTGAQSAALNRYPAPFHLEAGAADTGVIWYGVAAEANVGGTYNNVGVVPAGINKFALAVAPSGGQSASSLNGAAVVNRAGVAAGGVTQLFLGGASATPNTTALNGWLRRLRYFPRRVSDAELQALTA